MTWFSRKSLADYQMAFWFFKEWQFQRWLKRERPRRPELNDIPVSLQRLLFERRDRAPAVELATVLLVHKLEGTRYLAALDNMMQGRALEYRNVRFRKRAGNVIEAAVQTSQRPHTLQEAQEAFEHAEDVLQELQANTEFASMTRDLQFEFSLVYEQPEKSDDRDIVYYRKAGDQIVRSSGETV